MADIFVLLGIVVMAMWIWEKLGLTKQQEIKKTAHNIHNTLNEKFDKKKRKGKSSSS